MMKMKRKRAIGRITIAIIAIVLISGCRGSTPPVRFYTLNPVIESSEVKTETNVRQNLAVGVGPIEIPKSIDRPQIVTRTSPNRVSVDEFHRWAGSLREDFKSALAADLAILLKSDRVIAYPWEDYFRPVYQIFLDVHRFDGEPGKHLVLDITCTITDGEGIKALFVHRSRIQESVPETDFEALVSANNRAIATLSRELAQIIIKLEADAN